MDIAQYRDMDIWSKIENGISSGFSLAFRFLGSRNPLRTSLGVCIGLFLRGIFDIIEIVMQSGRESSESVSLDGIGSYFFFAVGILIMYFPVLIEYINPKREEIFDENLDKVFAALRKILKDGNIDLISRRKLYEQIAQAVIDKLKLTDEFKKEIKQQISLAQDGEIDS